MRERLFRGSRIGAKERGQRAYRRISCAGTRLSLREKEPKSNQVAGEQARRARRNMFSGAATTGGKKMRLKHPEKGHRSQGVA